MEFGEILKTIMKDIGITAGELSKRSGLSPSVISRYRSGERKPTADSDNIRVLAEAIASYAQEIGKTEFTANSVLEDLLKPLGVTVIIKGAPDTNVADAGTDIKEPAHDADISNFLKCLDEFHLQQYLRVLKSDIGKYSASDIIKPNDSKTCVGLNGIRSGLTSLLWNSGDKSFVCYIDTLTGALDSYPAKMRLQLEMAMIHALQKGTKITRIDKNPSGSVKSVQILEDALPFLMVGGYSLYRDETISYGNQPFPTLVALSDDTVLSAQANGSDEAFYYALSSHDNAALAYQWNQFRDIMENGSVTAHVYRRSDRLAYHSLLTTLEASRKVSIRANTLPIATIPDSMLDTILARSGILGDKLLRIKNFVTYERNRLAAVSDSVGIDLSVPTPSSEDFSVTPLSLGLSDLFEGGIYRYTFDEYRSHLAVTESFIKQHKKSRLTKESATKYPHLYINDIADDLIIIAKDHAPASVLIVRDRLICDLVRRA